MKSFALIGMLWLATYWTAAQQPAPPAALRSASGQFLIFDRRAGTLVPSLPSDEAGLGYVELEPTILVVSCERVREALYYELGAEKSWRGKIQVEIRRYQNGDDSTELVLNQFRDGWSYQLSLPQRIERTKFIRTLVQVLLQEMANRTSANRRAEIPVWLIEGLTQRLVSSRAAELILPPPTKTVHRVQVESVNIPKREQDLLETTRKILRERPPLSIEALSFWKGEQLLGPAGEPFRCNAHLFVTELLRLEHGKQCLRATVTKLGKCLNWQTAFLNAFEEYFPNQLALEKWWALQLVYFVGRDPFLLWTPTESAERLGEVLRTPVAIRQLNGEMPAHGEISLQTVIREWDDVRQTTIVTAKLRELELIRTRVAPELVPLIDEYRNALVAYQGRRERAGKLLGLNWFSLGASRTPDREILQQLDRLDAKRTTAATKKENTVSIAR